MAISDELRQRLEGDLTSTRIAELRLSPVVGQFDAAHLREVNRRIFQDLPKVGFADVTPGEFRPTLESGKDWMKGRSLESSNATFFVAYSRMDEKALQRLHDVLSASQPDTLRQLPPASFVEKIAKLYSELDYRAPRKTSPSVA